MLKRRFDPQQPHIAVSYLRFSSDMQNPRSCAQQKHELESALARSKYPWQIVREYQDDGISGRYIRKRVGYQQMLIDIKSGALQVDLILADTIERFGRVEELPTIRKDLYENYGVLVLTADSHFCDPTTPQGKALSAFESMRATEDSRVKAHNVLRGKRDSARQKHWPGGPAPIGFSLQSVMKEVHGRQEVDYCVLVPDPQSQGVISHLFHTALNTGYGTTRLARTLNEDPDVPADLKPFRASTIGHILDNPIYYGELLFNKHSTGIVADVRVIEKNDEADWDRVPEFCGPLVSKELWMQVQALREVRRSRNASAAMGREAAGGKQIEPTAAGMTLNYLLSGLLYCHACGIRMTLSSTKPYTAKSGETRNYAGYGCPGYLSGCCSNNVRVPEDWLREVVVDTLRQRLFPWR